jgi:ribA/ribD-fused uncharacterized protein
MAILFYSTSDQYGALSNFSPHPIEIDGIRYPTVEHYFQAKKFHDEAYREKIRLASNPKTAKTLGRSRKVPIRTDWEQVKDEIMLQACRAKFLAHNDVKELLLSTGDEELIENAANDYYWGCGRSGTGKNRLGEILMRVRDELRTK